MNWQTHKVKKTVLEEIPPPPDRVCSVIPRECHASAEPRAISEFRWFPIKEEFSKMCATCRALNRRMQTQWRDRNPELAAERSLESRRAFCKDHPERHAEYQRRQQEDKIAELSKDPAALAAYREKNVRSTGAPTLRAWPS